jgi:hypothetical protein
VKPVRAPSRRESIEDHIATARACLRRAHVEADATRAWVRDLAHEGMIDGPRSSPKAAGCGRRERFAPSDYGDLMETMRLRAEGAIHRSTWLVWLWLRGRDFPLAIVREALPTDLRRNLSKMRRQFAPTGRDTEPFTVKFPRNVASQNTDCPISRLRPALRAACRADVATDRAKDLPLDPKLSSGSRRKPSALTRCSLAWGSTPAMPTRKLARPTALRTFSDVDALLRTLREETLRLPHCANARTPVPAIRQPLRKF